MFTGIVEELGTVQRIRHKDNLSQLIVEVQKVMKGLKLGDSVAVDGVCLTVTKTLKKTVTFDIMKETLLRTTLGQLKKHDKVNLERALKIGSRIDGHFVTGHVDDIGIIQNKVVQKNYTELKIGLKNRLRKYLVEKGSISVDGVSLTVGKVTNNSFSVYLIPFTKQVTTLGFKKKGQKVNIETDMLAKYILKS